MDNYKKQEMKILIAGMLIILAFPVLGQSQSIGFKSGINMNNVNSKEFIDDTGNRIGFTSGFTYEAELKKQIFVGADFLYSQKGFTDEIVLTDNDGVFIGEETTRFNYDYLSIPIKAGLKKGRNLTGAVCIGIIPSILIKHEYILPTITDDLTINETKKVNSFDFAGLIELSVDYKLNNSLLLFTSLSYQRSFTSITNSEYFSDSKIWHYSESLSFGIKYRLKK